MSKLVNYLGREGTIVKSLKNVSENYIKNKNFLVMNMGVETSKRYICGKADIKGRDGRK